MVEVRAQEGVSVPEGYEALGLDALARRLGVSRMTAHRRLIALVGQQHRPDVLRVVRLPVVIGSGARRLALHVLWPLPAVASSS